MKLPNMTTIITDARTTKEDIEGIEKILIGTNKRVVATPNKISNMTAGNIIIYPEQPLHPTQATYDDEDRYSILTFQTPNKRNYLYAAVYIYPDRNKLSTE